ncbi:gephyrin: PROVISIONAL [Gigaspora margarita]|uniref:Gephyrin: PROVISIONAL n=1 Tax=Gigaspora margarita TaxID=4874 RepID=A0A8H4A384_GIGMA|nr:gephyrin: PROVISIONAL [Gigaspora margarita]
MMDKHRPTKLALQGLIRRTILCWFYIILTLGEHLKIWKVKWPLRYLIALAFKIEDRSRSDEKAVEMEHLYVLFGFVIPIPGQENYMLVEKQKKVFYSFYTFHPINIPANILEKINEMIVKLVNRENFYISETCYLVNTLSGECTYYNCIWNSPFRDVCKHVYAAQQYTKALHEKLQMQEIKEKLVQHFKDKENVVVPKKKNYIIYRGTSNKVYQEIFQECYNENFSDLTITEITEISEIPISDIENVNSHSIHRCNTTRVHNKRQTHSQAIYSNGQENVSLLLPKDLSKNFS